MSIHFGILCPPTAGHLNPMGALSRELQRRGHRATFVGTADGEARARAMGFDYRVVGSSNYPLGAMPKFFERALSISVVSALGYSVKFTATRNEMLCREVPAVLRSLGVQALLVDQLESSGRTLAEHLGVPFATVCNALPINYEPSVPPYFTAWEADAGPLSETMNRLGYAAFFTACRSVDNQISRVRREWGLPPLQGPNSTFSPLLQLSQMIREFDFPRKELPSHFHYTGPLRDPLVEQDNSFSIHLEKMEPLIYASMGTIVNSRKWMFERIAQACEGLKVKLVVAHGGSLSEKEAASLPGSPTVTAYAPQQKIIDQADLVVTHAGLNTVLDALSAGVPMVCLPISGEQPGIAARVQKAGMGLCVSDPETGQIRAAIEEVLDDASFKQRAHLFQSSIRAAGGAKTAADLVEKALTASCRTAV